ncbi:uncharacterized protein TrAFT101_003413 [Trichoderma asperellum]|uniref:uncharacterized protein n=1 Tax=Trichoderma asperellum TaxID=101201 RepID=UPI0033242373|nr:hypothetical protein TrAFT101_003413 [Trichoderma asperellum]
MHGHHRSATRIEFAAVFSIPAARPNGFSALAAVDLARMLLHFAGIITQAVTPY